ncbi:MULTISPECIES: hypothetical protein [unclassified Photobacterium]|uniref:hypothetical protein n=1 Tax=unclassified Photobacterium TaxID=2628852 RepID=UPI000D17102A|nr:MULTISPECIES: hypothetical protein [unclassified Photobacterium]PSV28393.1 hypothetical protein C9J42_04380 [Photobacterium sp. GB-56]PSV30611.1 hypothetical protein C9J40_11620 [Photobacterium sp. GB-72]PSV34421.1 hypothetical protein C9J44_15925 [Photobacterium sp. GB-27]PSV43468.1 hypothetical protein C9J46_11780 [Photobacterium sp. GB-36]PSV51816.1 hypothetical protein C9J45_13940 [Photobacterium sp. GB-1]
MLDTYLSYIKILTKDFAKYFLATVLVLSIKGELFNIGLRVWSDNEMSFYEDGLWQITLILSFLITCCVMINKYAPE